MCSRFKSCMLGLLFALGVNCLAVQAGMISTDQIVNGHDIKTDLLVIKSALAREEVKQVLLEHGVHIEQVQHRVDQLTEEELHQLANQFAELPAGSGAAALLLVSGPVMLLLEFMGMTDLTTAF